MTASEQEHKVANFDEPMDDPMGRLWYELEEMFGDRLLDLFYEDRYESAYGDTFKYTLIIAAPGSGRGNVGRMEDDDK